MSAIPNPIKALITVLKADANVAALAGTRVFGASLPKSENHEMSLACVILKPAGGPETYGSTNDFGDLRVDAICYGADELEAWNLYRSARAAMKQLERSVHDGVLLHWSKPLTAGATGIDPETGWPVCVGSFHVLAAEVPAA